MTTYKDRFDSVILSGKHAGAIAKIGAIAQLIYGNDTTQNKADCIWQALEEYESMTGRYLDPTQDQFDDIKASII